MFNVSNVTHISTAVTCPLGAVTLSLAILILLSGVLGNAIVITFIRRERRSKKTPNLLLLFHMSVNNFLALLTSLSLHVILTQLVPRDLLPAKLANILCALRPISQFIYLKVGLLTLTGICLDRYEIFTRMTKVRIFTKRRARRFVIASWIAAFTSSVLAGYGYIQNAILRQVYCEMNPHFVRGLETRHQHVSDAWVITDVSIWITACNVVDVYTLWEVGKVLMRHIDAVKSSLGGQETLQEIKIVKMSVYVFLAYAVVWMPYGVARGLLSSLKNNTIAIDCFYTLSQTVSYAIFAIIPFIYIGTNKRMLRETLRMARPTPRFPFSRSRAPVALAVSPLGDAAESELTSNTGETHVSSQM